MNNKRKFKSILAKSLLIIMLLSTIGALCGCGSESPSNAWFEFGDGSDIHCHVPTGGGDFEDETISGFFGAKFKLFYFGTVSDFTASPKAANLGLFRYLYAMLDYSVFYDTGSGGGSQTARTLGLLSKGIYAQETYGEGIKLSPAFICETMEESTLTILADGGTENIFSSLFNAIKSLIAGIIVVFWLVQFLQQILQERFTMESFLKGFCQLVIGILITYNAQNIAGAFIGTAHSVFSSFAGSTISVTATSGYDFVSTFCNWVHTMANSHVMYNGFAAVVIFIRLGGTVTWLDFGSVGAFFCLLLPFVGQLICAYQIVSQMFMRLLELILRIAFAPIPLAFGAAQGFGPSSLSFLKGTLACGLQPVLIMVAARAFQPLMNLMANAFSLGIPIAESFLGGLFILIGYIILSGFIGQTKQLSQEIIAR